MAHSGNMKDVKYPDFVETKLGNLPKIKIEH